MHVAIDACSLINLHNAGALRLASRLSGLRLNVCPGVFAECGRDCTEVLLELELAGSLTFIDDDSVPAGKVLDLLAKHGLGQGETESIAACETFGYALCTDDGPARKLALERFGQPRVMGSLRILRLCVEEGLVACTSAYGHFAIMLEKGGFLPMMGQEYFCSRLDGC